MSSYDNCYQGARIIQKETIPNLKQEYDNFIQYVKKVVVDFNNHSLNEVRSITNGAKHLVDYGYGDSKNENNYVASLLEELNDINNEMIDKAYYVNDQLIALRNSYIEKTKSFCELNDELVESVSSQKTPADELIEEVISLGQNIQNYTNNEVINFQNELSTMLNHIEKTFVKPIQDLYYEIRKQDNTILKPIHIEWIQINDDFFSRTPLDEYVAKEI